MVLGVEGGNCYRADQYNKKQDMCGGCMDTNDFLFAVTTVSDMLCLMLKNGSATHFGAGVISSRNKHILL
eukprot:12281314-Karenia_brevis.AAC.1